MKSLELMKSIESVELRGFIGLIESSRQQNIYCMCTLLRIFSVVYILRDPRTNFFLLFVKKTKREKKSLYFGSLSRCVDFFFIERHKK